MNDFKTIAEHEEVLYLDWVNCVQSTFSGSLFQMSPHTAVKDFVLRYSERLTTLTTFKLRLMKLWIHQIGW